MLQHPEGHAGGAGQPWKRGSQVQNLLPQLQTSNRHLRVLRLHLVCPLGVRHRLDHTPNVALLGARSPPLRNLQDRVLCQAGNRHQKSQLRSHANPHQRTPAPRTNCQRLLPAGRPSRSLDRPQSFLYVGPISLEGSRMGIFIQDVNTRLHQIILLWFRVPSGVSALLFDPFLLEKVHMAWVSSPNRRTHTQP